MDKHELKQNNKTPPASLEQSGSEFRKILRQSLTAKMKLNPSYSLRSFAKNLGVAPSTLSMVMSGRCPVTLKFIDKVATKLKLTEDQVIDLQLDLIKSNQKIKNDLGQYSFIESETFEAIKDWYHYAILNFIRTKDFKPEARWVAKRLGLTLGEVQTALEHLKHAGLLKIEKGEWIDLTSKKTTHTDNRKYSEAKKEHQRQVFSLAREAIDKVDFQKRNHTGVTISFNLNQIEEAKNFISQFREAFLNRFDCVKQNGDEVYHLSVGFFPMTGLDKKNEI